VIEGVRMADVALAALDRDLESFAHAAGAYAAAIVHPRVLLRQARSRRSFGGHRPPELGSREHLDLANAKLRILEAVTTETRALVRDTRELRACRWRRRALVVALACLFAATAALTVYGS
jgi:hypothetical protein